MLICRAINYNNLYSHLFWDQICDRTYIDMKDSNYITLKTHAHMQLLYKKYTTIKFFLNDIYCFFFLFWFYLIFIIRMKSFYFGQSTFWFYLYWIDRYTENYFIFTVSLKNFLMQTVPILKGDKHGFNIWWCLTFGFFYTPSCIDVLCFSIRLKTSCPVFIHSLIRLRLATLSPAFFQFFVSILYK